MQKRDYEKGEIKRVKLVPEEAVLLSCKSTVTAGPTAAAHCIEGGGIIRCLELGS